MILRHLALLCIATLGTAGLGVVGTASAQSTDEMRRQILDLSRQVQQMKERMDQQQGGQPAAPAGAGSHGNFLERKPGDGFTVYTRGGELSLYGVIDVSVDDTTKGIGSVPLDGSSPPIGNTGWMTAISSNLSYVGVRGFQTLDPSTNFVYQLETQIDVSNTPGTANTNSNNSDQVKGALASRNSFIGLASSGVGAVKIGKTDAPYKSATARMNPFVGMLGDYSVIMGNTGGDNRVEFGTRLAHAMWYESPNWSGVRLNALFSPGQNRASDSSNIPAGEQDCAGGNIPGSGQPPGGALQCNDGSFSNAYSVNLSYEISGLYVTAAYEMHKNVNRTGDVGGNPLDVANEDAKKIGLQYKFPTGTTFSAIYEMLRRHVDASLSDQNERSRNGFWLALSQQLGADDSLHLGWAHAARADGDPGQHNPDPTQADANGFFPGVNNSANMYTGAWKHQMDKNLNWYINYATTINSRFAHYDLGAGGRSVTTDCHDATNLDNPSAPHCYTGARLQGVSLGLHYTF